METDYLKIEMSGSKAKLRIQGYIGVPESWQNDPEQSEKVISTKEKMRDELEKIANLKASQIEVDIDSFGGDINHGMAIYNALVYHKAKVIVNYVGWSASAATVIGAAGDEVNAPSNFMGLIHEARGMAYGKSNDLKASADMLELINDNASIIYSLKSGKKKEKIREIMSENRGEGVWKSALDLKEIGLIDNVTEPIRAVASHDEFIEKTKFFNINNSINMSLFKKQTQAKTFNSIVLGEITAVHEGELKEGIELIGVGSELKDGTYELEGKTVTVENSAVKEIKVKEQESVLLSEVQNRIDLAVKPLNEKITTLEAENAELKKLSGTHKPPKTEKFEDKGQMSEEDFQAEMSRNLNSKNFGRK